MVKNKVRQSGFLPRLADDGKERKPEGKREREREKDRERAVCLSPSLSVGKERKPVCVYV